MRSLSFFLKQTINGIRRHSTGSLVTFLQVFISLFFLGLCLIFIINVNHFVDNFLNNLEMGAFLSDDLTYEQAVDLMDIIKDLQGVKSVTYISKEEAFSIMQQRTTMDISDLVRSNPLPASLKITVTSPRAAKELADSIRLLEGVQDVRYGEAQLQTLLPIFYGLELISFFWVVFTAGATLMTIVNTVRLAILARKKEIRIMQLVGATSWFIRLPFLIEGLLYGLGGAALAMFLVAVTYNVLLQGIAARNIFNPWVIDFKLMMYNLGIILFFLGGLIGVIASLIAVGKHLEADVYHPPYVTQGVTSW
jgi:cell division transport system permease protein